MRAIIVVLPKLENAKKVRKILIEHGFSNVFAYSCGAAALQQIDQYSHGLIISGYRLRDMYYVELQEQLPPNFQLVLIGRASTVEDVGAGVLSLTLPLKVYDLVNTVEMVSAQVEHRLKKHRAPRKRTEQEQNYIRNAKFLLMERNHLSEEEAHRYIQKCSMDTGTNMVETAQIILTLMFEEG